MLPEVAQFGNKHGLEEAALQELHGLMSASITLTSKRVTIAVPATVANLGPGIDTCGLAVDIWDEVTVEYASEFHLEMSGDSSLVPRSREKNLAVAGVESAFTSLGKTLPAVRICCCHRIPWGRGLGAEAASFVGGFLAGSVLCGEAVAALGRKGATQDADAEATLGLIAGLAADGKRTSNVDTLMQLAISRGWSPGNVCPAIYGALQIGVETPSGFRGHRVPTPNGLVCVLFVPNDQPDGVSLPKQPVERKAAIANVGHMALLINCFCSGDFDMFAKAADDAIGRSHRDAQFPYMHSVVECAGEAGATGVFQCGYGPSVMALITGRTGDVLAQSSSNELERAVAKAMLSKADELGCAGRVLIAKPADIGAHVVAQKSELGVHEDNERIIYFQ